MRRVLFVDDERHVLDDIKDTLSRGPATWNVAFALGGHAALDTLKKATFDVVVCDLRMPDMDGTTLLSIIQRQFPGVARVVVSEASDRDLTLRCLPVAQQLVHKPLELGQIVHAVERACAMRAFLDDQATRDLVGSVDTLPTGPTTYWELVRAVGDENAGVADVAAIVSRDTAICAKVLQIVNSAYFGFDRKVTSVQDAVVSLGVRLLRGIALTAHVFVIAENTMSIEGFSLKALSQRAFSSGRLASEVCRGTDADDAFAAGVLHDVGTIVLGGRARDTFAEILQTAACQRRPRHLVERERLGTTHAAIGAYLLGLWGLPVGVVEAVAFHHAPALAPDRSAHLALGVHVATSLSAEAAGDDVEAVLDLDTIERAGWTHRLGGWRNSARRLSSLSLA